METTTDPDPFAGWLRTIPHGRWQRVCGGETESLCWRALLDVRPAGCNQAEKMVLPAGRHPNDTRK